MESKTRWFHLLYHWKIMKSLGVIYQRTLDVCHQAARAATCGIIHVLHAGDDSAHVRTKLVDTAALLQTGMLPFHKAADCAIDRVVIHASKSSIHARVARNVGCPAINISLATGMMFTIVQLLFSWGSVTVLLPVDAPCRLRDARS